ncbi:MAG: cytochrome P450 [Actinobacteria bacterium]|nr:cytochrome P450 [Actinomycetota bacterium]
MNLNFFDPEVIANPFPHYEEMHAQGPVVRNDLFGAWMVPSHHHALEVLKNPGMFSSVGIAQMATDRVDAFGGAQTMLFADPPDHERLRGVVQQAFTPRAIGRLEPRVREIVDELLGPVHEGDSIDVMDRLAYPLPVIVIAEMLGVPAADRPLFKEWSDALVNGMSETAGMDDQSRSREAGEELRAYFGREIAARRLKPLDDLVTRMVRANEVEGTLSDDELLASCVLLLVAGNETTTKFIGNMALYLAGHPDVRAKLAADPSKAPRAFEEMVRLAGPVQATVRVARGDTRIGATPVAAGETVFVMLAAANRDSSVFVDPTRADIDRWPNPHLGFGHGIHFCIGAMTARLESQIAFERLLQIAPDYELEVAADALHYAPSFFLRGLERLPVRMTRRAAPAG